MVTESGAGRIFISYRREDAAYAAGWLYDRLSDRFGGGQIFKDVDSLEPGDDFVEKITAAVSACDVLLAVIGPDWVAITDDEGKPRLHDKGDFVRLEIEAALSRRVRVIPLLVEGARMPRSTDLPSSLAPLVRRHALELTSGHFSRDADDLVSVLQKAVSESTGSTPAKTATVPDPSDQGTDAIDDAPAPRRQAPPSARNAPAPAGDSPGPARDLAGAGQHAPAAEQHPSGQPGSAPASSSPASVSSAQGSASSAQGSASSAQGSASSASGSAGPSARAAVPNAPAGQRVTAAPQHVAPALPYPLYRGEESPGDDLTPTTVVPRTTATPPRAPSPQARSPRPAPAQPDPETPAWSPRPSPAPTSQPTTAPARAPRARAGRRTGATGTTTATRPPVRRSRRRSWWWLAGVLVVVVLVGFGVLRLYGPGASSVPRASAPLPDDAMVWRRQRDGVFRLATIHRDGSGERLLTSTAGDNAAVISPDRRTVLFLRGLSGSADPIGLWAVAADGTDERQLFADQTASCPRLHRPAWRTGELLAVVCDGPAEGEPGTLNLLKLDGTLVRTLDRGRMGDPTFTADGSAVVYWRNLEGDGDGGALFEVATDGRSAPVQLTPGGDGRDADPACAPVGDDVVFRRTEGREQRIYRITSGQGLQRRPQPLAAGDRNAQDPSWSPDGSQISFRAGPSDASDLWVMDADGGSARPVVANAEQDGVSVWSAR